MAITKIHPIKTTLNLSIDYICDPTKTDEEILISTFLCGHRTAALEFAKTREKMNSQSKNLARHLIQSFMPGEVSSELAHQIGQELCDEHLQGKYEYVLTTHIDKGHIHNHIIFNNVSHQDGKAYISNKKSYHQIRNISDSLCKEHQLSIATESSTGHIRNKTKGSSYKEYQERKKGNSYKAKLQYAIDLAIKRSKDWEDFLRILQSQGYEIKYGKHISFRAVGQERFTRAKTIGEDYSEERITERISHQTEISKYSSVRKASSSSRVIDITSDKLAMQSEGFARWLKLQNLKNISRSWNTITADGITDLESFYVHVEKNHDELGQIQNEIKAVEVEIQDTADKIKNINTYNKYKSTYADYQKSTDKDAYFREHESEIILFEAADLSLTSYKVDRHPKSISHLKTHLNKLSSNHNSLDIKLKQTKENVSEINRLRHDLDTYLRSDIISKIGKSDR